MANAKNICNEIVFKLKKQNTIFRVVEDGTCILIDEQKVSSIIGVVNLMVETLDNAFLITGILNQTASPEQASRVTEFLTRLNEYFNFPTGVMSYVDYSIYAKMYIHTNIGTAGSDFLMSKFFILDYFSSIGDALISVMLNYATPEAAFKKLMIETKEKRKKEK